MRHVYLTMRGRWMTALAASGLALLAACGTGSSTPSGGVTSASAPPSSPTAVATGPLCADAAALRASLSKLTHVTIGMGAAAEISADLAEVKSNLDTLTANAGAQWHAQTAALKAALTTAGTAVKNLASQPSAAGVSAVVSAIGKVNTAAQNLLAAVNTDCPSVSPLPST